MFVKRIFPCALALCFALSLYIAQANAQTTDETRPRQVTTSTDTTGNARLETDPIIISEAPNAVPTASRVPSKTMLGTPLLRFNGMLLSAIDARLGAPYVYGAEGPRVFDCSGFVWSVFQSAGISFERGSARTLWSRFLPVREEEDYKFGTLVFFSGLTHIGIVADANGFYHASRSKGVVYSPFNKYWLARIDGFRRVPVPAAALAE